LANSLNNYRVHFIILNTHTKKKIYENVSLEARRGKDNLEGGDMQPTSKPKQSRFGITSVVLCAVALVAYYAIFWGSLYLSDGSLIGVIFEKPNLILVTVVFSGFTLGLGILGLFEKDHNRLFAIIGIVVSSLFLIAEVFGYFLIKLMLSVPW
jgi:hypothetical protein